MNTYSNKEINKDLINQLIEAAIQAPSSMDCQPWQFVVVKDIDIKKNIGELKGEDNAEIIFNAPILIIICVDTDKSPSRFVEDGVTATENLLLAAHSIGLGSVYISGYKANSEITTKLQGIIGLGKNILPITILPIGYIDLDEKLEKKGLLKVNDVIKYI